MMLWQWRFDIRCKQVFDFQFVPIPEPEILLPKLQQSKEIRNEIHITHYVYDIDIIFK